MKCQKCQAMEREGSKEVKRVRITRGSGNVKVVNLCDTCLIELEIAAATQRLPVMFNIIKQRQV